MALTTVFVTAALTYGVQARRASQWQVAGTWSLHALAAAAMAAMLWPAAMVVSPVLYVLFFTACGLFAGYVGAFYGTLPHWRYHTAMMAAMAAMPVLMTASPVATAMPMMVHHGQHMTMAAAPNVGSATPGWLAASSAVLAGFLLLSALWWFYLLIRGAQRPYSHLLMAMGMGTCFALCI
jgi:uncharacterized protein DUF5134